MPFAAKAEPWARTSDRIARLPRTLTQMAGRMWNHSPEMWAAMKAKGIQRPTFEGKEMADLIAFLYSVRYFELGGSPIIGQQLFEERKCSQCHGSDAGGGTNRPQPEEGRPGLYTGELRPGSLVSRTHACTRRPRRWVWAGPL